MFYQTDKDLLNLIGEHYSFVEPDLRLVPRKYRVNIIDGILDKVLVDRLLHFDNPDKIEKLDKNKLLEAKSKITAQIESFESKKSFPKLINKSSCNLKFFSEKKYIENGGEFVKVFIDDPEVFDLIWLYNRNKKSIPYRLTEFIELQPMLEEVRLFCIDKKVVYTSQYCVQEQIDNKEVKPISEERKKKAIDFYNTNIKDYANKDIFVADIGFKKNGDPILIEFNPFLHSHKCLMK